MTRLSAPACVLLLLALTAAPGRSEDGELRLAVIVTRHGVRPPVVDANRQMGALATQPWPAWEAPPGALTPHGRRLMRLMGTYYRDLYIREGLLSGDGERDGRRLYLRADNDERTISSASALADGILGGPGASVHALPAGRIDPLFEAVMAGLGPPDLALAEAELRGRIGGDPRVVASSCAASLALLDRVMLGTDGPAPPGKEKISRLPGRIIPDNRAAGMATLGGEMMLAHRCAENLLLEYAEGKPPEEVGWGRVDRRVLEQLMPLDALFFHLTETAPYRSRAQASNLASHIIATLEQGAADRAVPGAIGGPGCRLIVLCGHDTNLAALGGLLGVSWWLEGQPPNPTLPGGALVFELRRRPAGRFAVRLRYVSQTPDQMRSAEPLSLLHPPAQSPIFIPECGGAGPGYDAPLESFRARLHRLIDEHFVAADS